MSQIIATMGELSKIHDAELKALLETDFDEIMSLRMKLSQIREVKIALIHSYRLHIFEHGC